MAEVIFLSDDDDDDIQIIPNPDPPRVLPQPAALPPTVLRTNSSANLTTTGATVHISGVSKINLEQLGIRSGPAVPNRNVPLTLNRNGPPPIQRIGVPTARPSLPIVLRVPPQVSNIRPLKRPNQSLPNVVRPQVVPITSQRTRNTLNAGSKPPEYQGHYMFEATEAFEPSRRSSRFNAKKIEGKFICTYNPTTCYKFCGSVAGIINHAWAHVVHDPLYELQPEESSTTSRLYALKQPSTFPILAKESTLALLKMRTCEYCNATFCNIYKKQLHVNKCHLSKKQCPTVCNICEIDLETAPAYTVHMNQHIPGDAPYNCAKCKYRTSVRKYFYEHFIEKHSNEGLICPICLHNEDLRPSTRKSHYIYVRDFLTHMSKHATHKQFRCQTCALSFNSREEQKHHYSTHHTPLNQLWQIRERPNLHEEVKIRMPKQRKISTLVQSFLNSPEGRRIKDEVACPSNEERTGFDLTSTGNTLFKCACGYSTWNGNRIASHYHRCNKGIKNLERKREVYRTERDPKDELEMFAVYPQKTNTEKETERLQEIILQKLKLKEPDLEQINLESYECEPFEDLVLLKMVSNKNDRSRQIIKECFEAIMLNDDD